MSIEIILLSIVVRSKSINIWKRIQGKKLRMRKFCQICPAQRQKCPMKTASYYKMICPFQKVAHFGSEHIVAEAPVPCFKSFALNFFVLKRKSNKD